MNVCLDVQAAIAQRAGVGRYVRQLAEHLASLSGRDTLTLFYFDFRRQGVPPMGSGAQRKSVRWVPGRWVQQAWKRFGFPPFDWFAGDADLYHFPNFILPPLSGRRRAVVTVHDMAFLRYPEFAEERNRRYLEARIRDTVRRADLILTDSRFSEGEIHELLGVAADRVRAIPLGVEPTFGPVSSDHVREVRERHGLARPYLLTVSTIEPRKNLAFMGDVFDRLGSYDGDLVLAGMPGWKWEPIVAHLRGLRRGERIRFLQYVPDGDLPALYAGADLFLCTSHYEGFGLPPLEAMACGIPVVSSTGGSLGEVLGDAALLVRTFDPDAWTDAVGRALADRELRERLSAAGRRQAAGFRWEETARQTWSAYRSLAA
jgi:glycosyltransferase involved in cell wall biosynthesis